MKQILSILLLLLVAGGLQAQERRQQLTDWRLRIGSDDYKVSVPGCIHTDLMALHRIADPFYSTNEDSVQWVENQEWSYKCSFVATQKSKKAELVFEGLATYATITLNGKKIGSTNNMFRQYRFPIKRHLRRGENLLEVTFSPTRPKDDSLAARLGIPLPDYRATTRTAPYMQGWDWGPRLNTCGIWQPVWIDYAPDEISDVIPTFEDWGITLVQERDSIGQSFTFYQNNRPIFAKGANWIPCHSFPVLTPALEQRYRQLLCAAKEANFNMLRVWGGGIYEPDLFYDLCDSLGIMVWQDLNFSCALYPGESDFLDNVEEEVRQQVYRIAHHPCVVVWCGNNEVENGWQDWGWQKQYGWTEEQEAYLRHAKDTLFSTHGLLAQIVYQEDPLRRPYIASSPTYGWGHPECTTHGDSHYWGVWWGEEPFSVYKEKTGRFMSEYGFQSYPDYSTILRYCPQEQLTITSPAMKNHQKHPRGVEIIDKAMMDYYGLDSKSLTLEDYAYLSQILQAYGVGYGIYCHLKAQPHCMGSLYWQLNDCWPVASWSSIDYYGNWKALHYRVRDLFDADADLDYWERYYQGEPKAQFLALPRADYSVEVHPRTVTITAQTDLKGVYVDYEPHIDGHFTDNYFDLKAGESKTISFVPATAQTGKQGAINMFPREVRIKTLNDLVPQR